MKTNSIQKVIYTIKHMYMHMNRVNSSLTLHEVSYYIFIHGGPYQLFDKNALR